MKVVFIIFLIYLYIENLYSPHMVAKYNKNSNGTIKKNKIKKYKYILLASD